MNYKVSTEKPLLDLDLIIRELQSSYWASNRTPEQIRKSIISSLCFGAFKGQRQVGFARVVTDYATTAYLCDVFVVKDEQGCGVGKLLLQELLSYPTLTDVSWFLRTKDAHGLYEQFNFVRNDNPTRYMERKPTK